MAKPPQARRKATTKAEKVELDLDADAWPKFEALVKSAAKMGPKPHGTGIEAKLKKDSRK
jgi:hypothetical protein